MGFARFGASCVTIALCFVTVGCGSSGSGTTGGATAPAGGPHAAGGRTASSGAGGRTGHAVESPVQSRGIKGEDPSAEAATRLHISAADCKALEALAERQTGTRLAVQPSPAPPLSRCRLSGRGASIAIYLDSGFAAAQRYRNRIEETVQFGYQDAAKVPHPVPHVGDKAAYNADASWIPALRSLLAVRGNRWLTVTLSVAGHDDRRLRAEATALARAGFKLTATG
jgi:hypothetical protein